MSGKLDLAGQIFGCWKIINPANSRVMNCGTTRTFWVAQCMGCLNTFDVMTKNLRRKWVFPSCCGDCKGPDITKKGFKYGRTSNGFLDKTVKIPI